jgi:ribosomal RNA-processing protein 17
MPPSSKRRKLNPALEAIVFDASAREEYLTGFRKRKQARIRHAQEQAAKKAKEDRDRERRELRQQRKEELEAKLREVGEYLRKADGSGNADEEDGEAEDEGVDEEGWEGFEEIPVSKIDRLDEYIDEDRYAEVTVEDVELSREGLVKAGQGQAGQGSSVHTVGDGEYDAAELDDKVTTGYANGVKKKRTWTKEKPNSAKPKKKRKKFRYETKEERKITRFKERRKNTAKAKARKG